MRQSLLARGHDANAGVHFLGHQQGETMRPFKAVSSFLYSGLALALSVSALSSAEAAVYRGKFTPDYGDPFGDLYWNGTLVVSAPDSCIPALGGQVTLLSCSGMKITDASVNLYKKTLHDEHPDTATPFATLDFDAQGWTGLNWKLTFGPGKALTGVTSTAFSAVGGGSFAETQYVDANDVSHSVFFSLQFLGDYAQLYWFMNEPNAFELFALTGGGLFEGPCQENGEVKIEGIPFVRNNVCGWSNPDYIDSTQGAFIKFELVPEPASLALVPLALGAMGFASVWAKRRRRSSAA